MKTDKARDLHIVATLIAVLSLVTTLTGLFYRTGGIAYTVKNQYGDAVKICGNTTQITYVLDMGIVGPTALICLFLLRRQNGTGYILLAILLTVCTVIGVMLPIQTILQIAAGIRLPMGAIVTKVSSFVVLALFALYFDIRLFKSIQMPA